jgi:Na+-driven multidrug efflux pump
MAPTDQVRPVSPTSSESSFTAPLTPEQERFEGKGPFLTILTFAVGPLIFNTGISFHDAVDLFLISRAFDSSALQVVGFSSLVRYLCLCVAIYYSQACITKIAGLMGENRVEDATKVVTDLYRVSIITMLVIPLVFFFVSEPLLLLMGCTPDLARQGREYLTPIFVAMPLITTFQLSCGFLQSEGRSLLCGAMQFAAFALNCGVLSPIMLFGLKVPLKYAGISFAVSQSVVGIVLMFCIFHGMFGLKPKWADWICGFHRTSFHGMLLALPFLINVLASTLPPMFLLSLMMRAAHVAGNAGLVGVVFPVYIKLNSAINSVSIGMCQGFMAAGSYAHSAQKRARFLELFRAVCLLTWCYHLILMPILVFRTDWPCAFWLRDPTELEFATRMIRIPFYTNTLIPLNFALINLLLSMKKAIVALVLTLLRGALYVAYSVMYYHVMSKDPIKMMYAYNTDDGTLFVLGLICAAVPLREVYRRAKEATMLESVDVSLLYTEADTEEQKPPSL